MQKKPRPGGRRSRKRRAGGRFDRAVLVGIVIAVLALALILWGPARKFRSGGKRRAAHRATQAESSEKQQKKTVEPARHEKMVLVAVVIDDLGQDLKPAKELLSLPVPITYAVMPGLPQSKKIAELARRNKREVLLHLPMEPKDRTLKISPGALNSKMTPGELVATIDDDIASVPGADGVNNHEGSALTENREAMKFLMAELKSRDLLFLDSFTSPKSTAYATAREFGLKTAKRDVFLDNESDNAAYIEGQLKELARIAKEHGRAIGIGHPHPATISAIRAWLATTSRQGIEIVPVSSVLN